MNEFLPTWWLYKTALTGPYVGVAPHKKIGLFFSECITKYGETEGAHIWNAINEVFDVLALAAVVDDKV